MHIVLSPDPILRQKCEPVDPSKIKKLRSTAKSMAKLMYKSSGCGLAAPQVGIPLRMIVVDCNFAADGEEAIESPTFYINPQVTYQGGEQEIDEEGCLSIPGISIPIKRFTRITVEALDLDGEPFVVEAEGFHARALQHELDHLDGTTMFEHLNPLDRIKAFEVYEEAVQGGAKPGDTGAVPADIAAAQPKASALHVED
ncbi:MAG: peptide deformylase [Coriobacteriia bacterium]|nr:peptide deformylase [Coriobacteriia bacterium]